LVNAMIIGISAITEINKRSSILEWYWFIIWVPNMLNKGIRTRNKTGGDVTLCQANLAGTEKPLSILYTRAIKHNTNMLRVQVSGQIEIGSFMPKSGKSEFIIKVIHMTKARLRPTDNNNVKGVPN